MAPAILPGHQFACWYPVGSPENKAAFDKNMADGVPVTLAAAGRLQATEELTADSNVGLISLESDRKQGR